MRSWTWIVAGRCTVLLNMRGRVSATFTGGTSTAQLSVSVIGSGSVSGGGFIFGRLSRFVREIVAKLQKVIWPTRKELSTYTTVALVFILVIVAIVTSLDYGFTKLVFAVFG